MAGPTKKPRKTLAPDSDEDYESDESGAYEGQQEIQATFEGRTPEAHDCHGIKQLLHQLFLNAHIDIGQMSDMIIAQRGIGSVLKQAFSESDDDDDLEMSEGADVFGVSTVINLTSHRAIPCVQQFYELIDEMIDEHAPNDNEIKEIVTSCPKFGFLINERFVNIPSRVSVDMLGILKDEVDRMKSKDSSYDFDYLIMISKTWKPKGDSSDQQLTFSNEEETVFMNNADYSFEYCVANKSGTGISGQWKSDDPELLPYRRVFLFKTDKFEKIVTEITKLLKSWTYTNLAV